MHGSAGSADPDAALIAAAADIEAHQRIGRPSLDKAHGRFEIMFITEDDQRHVAVPSPVAMIALIALAQADTLLFWDPCDRTLITANVIGKMPWTEPAQPGAPPRGEDQAPPA